MIVYSRRTIKGAQASPTNHIHVLTNQRADFNSALKVLPYRRAVLERTNVRLETQVRAAIRVVKCWEKLRETCQTMSLLPRTAEEFSSAEYWDRFFKRRGENAFEWYGDYNKLCGILHKYIKVQDKVLVIGCGNSELSEQLYDVGYKHLTNIDISETVVTHMNQRNAARRPGLSFHQVDATQTLYKDASFQVSLDKGTLDAMASEEGGDLASRMLHEVSRVLSIGGRYICVTLAQEHVISLAVEHFVHMGWAVRLHCIQEERGTEEEDSFALPVFVLVCIKFRQPLATPILELCIGDSGAPVRQEQVCELLSAVREHQAYSVLRKRLRTSFNPSANLSLTLCQANSGLPRYTLTVQDSPPGGKIPRSNQFAIFIVPRGSETAWLYSSPEGRGQLAASANFRRLVIVAMHRNQEYTDMQAVQAELSPVVMDLAPPGMPANHQVPFLTVGGDLGWREEVFRGRSQLSGEYCVENVRGDDGEPYRRLVFLSNNALVQSESRLLSSGSAYGPASRQKKSKKRAKASAAAAPSSASLSVDSGFLCCAHHQVMVAALALLQEGMQHGTDASVSVLLVGLGGGGLPQFLRDFLPGVSVEVVELDPVMLEVAKEWFGFRPDSRLTVTVGDGLEHICALEKGGRLFDAIMLDVDNKDGSLGMSCPPAAFVETPFLQKIHNLLTSRGLFILNLVCRDPNLRKNVLEGVSSVFPTVFSQKIDQEVNEVLLCFHDQKDTTHILMSLNKCAQDLQSALSSTTTEACCRAQIDISELLKDLTVE
ncbi:eEF1A lysine and N-terminal methyltransferase isoform X1 [Oryzias melastigma]|uniref:eEF1A lysine and N-terminal methyltransferase isoform X1 n=1 Tax=Oryzias melastigma TaxID=30732 RepID=UPI00168CED2E|nr:eEF1A lysine and N-terminal methyltransferase isoform X1 [Oryzias melastigma]